MSNMKIVYDPKLEVEKCIDERVEKDWQAKYWHRSGRPFVGIAAPAVEKERETAQPSELESPESQDHSEIDLETLQEQYKEKFGKRPAHSYKNNRDRLKKKLAE